MKRENLKREAPSAGWMSYTIQWNLYNADTIGLAEIVTAFTTLGLCANSYWQHLAFKTGRDGVKGAGRLLR